MQGKEMGRNELTHRWSLIDATMPIVFMSEMVLSHLYGGKLFQQFVVDAWANCEQRRLNWARTHQHTLRSELYQGLQDAVVHDRHDGENVRVLGHKLILPSSYVGSSRFMTQLF